jgi:signal transduction histidine kinase
MNDTSNKPPLPRMLVVDDRTNACETLAAFFKDEFEITTACTRRDALEASANTKFDVVILDLRMENDVDGDPDSSGLRCLAELCKRDPSLPVIIFTAYPSLDTAREALRLGAADYVTKGVGEGPGGPGPLREAVRAAIARAQKAQPGASSSASPAGGFAGQLTDEALTHTTAAFIHRLLNEFASLRYRIGKMEELFATVPGELGKQIARRQTELAQTVDSIRYLLERFRNTIGRHPGLMRSIDVHEVLKDLANHFATGFSGRVVLNLAGGTCLVTGDHELLWHLFENLIRNGLEAISSCRRGKVTVSTSLDSCRKAVDIVVYDNGIGITAEALPRIFQPDYSTKPGGLGIGLYLVSRAVAIHGGQVQCKSKPGIGTEFTVTLPLQPEVKEDSP